MAVIVFVWLPRSKSVGHASMSGGHFYLSWWPDAPPTTPSSPAPDGFYFSGMPGRRLSIGEDKKAEQRIPDYASPPITGLDEVGIATWCAQVAANGPVSKGPVGKEMRIKRNAATYAVFTNNCSAMVIRGLLIGGAWKNPRFASVIGHNLIMTPRVVRDAAETLTGSWSEVITNANPYANLLRDAYEVMRPR